MTQINKDRLTLEGREETRREFQMSEEQSIAQVCARRRKRCALEESRQRPCPVCSCSHLRFDVGDEPSDFSF